MIKEFKHVEVSYKLPLSDGTVWGLTASREIHPWLKNFAVIMRLDSSDWDNVDRRLLFVTRKPGNLPNHYTAGNEEWSVFKQGSAYRIWSHSRVIETFIELNHNFIDHDEICVINMWSSLKQIYRYYVENNGGPIHATLAEFNGKGILIAASGGTGKSTCYNRLPNYWKPLADDNALVVRVNVGEYRVHPMPTWSDHAQGRKYSTFNSSYSVPLKGIFFLDQATEDKVFPIGKTLAIRKIYEGMKQIWDAYWNRIPKNEKQRMVRKVFNTAFNIAKNIPAYELRATLHGEFWKEIEKILDD